MTSFHFTVALCEDSRVLLIGAQNSLEPLANRQMEVLPVQSSPMRLKTAPRLRDARVRITSAPYKRTLRDLRHGVSHG